MDRTKDFNNKLSIPNSQNNIKFRHLLKDKELKNLNYSINLKNFIDSRDICLKKFNLYADVNKSIDFKIICKYKKKLFLQGKEE